MERTYNISIVYSDRGPGRASLHAFNARDAHERAYAVIDRLRSFGLPVIRWVVTPDSDTR